MELLREILKIKFWGNTLQDYGLAAFFFMGTILVLLMMDIYILKKLKLSLEKNLIQKFLC